jgi:hypothetical protein
MYKSRISKWDFGKNITKSRAKILLNLQFQQQNIGKATVFSINDKDLNLEHYLKRKGKGEYNIVGLSQPAGLLEYVTYWTPSPIPQFLQSPDVLHSQERLIQNIIVVFKDWSKCEIAKKITPLYSQCCRSGDTTMERLASASSNLQNRNLNGRALLSLAYKSLEKDLGT